MNVSPIPFTALPKLMEGKLSAPVFPNPSIAGQSVPELAGSDPFQYQLYVAFSTLRTFGEKVCDSLARNWCERTICTLALESGPPSVLPFSHTPPESTSVLGRWLKTQDPLKWSWL